MADTIALGLQAQLVMRACATLVGMLGFGVGIHMLALRDAHSRLRRTLPMTPKLDIEHRSVVSLDCPAPHRAIVTGTALFSPRLLQVSDTRTS